MGTTAVAVYDALRNVVAKLMKKSDKLNTVDKSDIKKLIDILITDHQNTINSTSILTTSDLKLFKERLLLTVNKSKNPSASTYTEYNKGLIKTSRTWEDKRYLGAMTNAQLEMVRILTDISKQLNVLFETEEIELLGCRMSQIAVLGIIEQASLLASFSNYYWNLLCSIADGTDGTIAGYRNDYLLKNCTGALAIINSLNNQNGRYNFLQDVLQSRQKQHDMVLSTDGTLFSKFNSPDNNTPIMNSFVGSGVLGFVLNIFGWANQLLDDFLYTRHLKNKETKEWMEVRIAKLKLDLQDMNPNDVQYQRMTKIIEGYDEKLRDIDRKLDKYVTSAMEQFIGNERYFNANDFSECGKSIAFAVKTMDEQIEGCDVLKSGFEKVYTDADEASWSKGDIKEVKLYSYNTTKMVTNENADVAKLNEDVVKLVAIVNEKLTTEFKNIVLEIVSEYDDRGIVKLVCTDKAE